MSSELVSNTGISFRQPGFSLLNTKWPIIGINPD